MASSSSSSANMITLLSSDGQQFTAKESVIVESETIKNIIEENCTGAIPLPNVDSATLAMVIEYCTEHTNENATEESLNNFDSKFVERDTNTLFNLVLAANYLDIKSLVDILCQKFADHIKDMTTEEVRNFFNIKNDLTPEEEKKIREEYPWAFE